MKSVRQARKGEKLPGFISYLTPHVAPTSPTLRSSPTANLKEDLTDPAFIIDIYRQRSYK